jgi:hypothetical protein
MLTFVHDTLRDCSCFDKSERVKVDIYEVLNNYVVNKCVSSYIVLYVQSTIRIYLTHLVLFFKKSTLISSDSSGFVKLCNHKSPVIIPTFCPERIIIENI